MVPNTYICIHTVRILIATSANVAAEKTFKTCRSCSSVRGLVAGSLEPLNPGLVAQNLASHTVNFQGAYTENVLGKRGKCKNDLVV